MRLFLPLLIAATLAQPVLATPMWEHASRWSCQSISHIKMTTDGRNVRVNEESNTNNIDFEAGTVTTGFSDAKGVIGETRYTESAYGGFNWIEVLWDGQSYPVQIVEKNGEWWETTASGWADNDREVWIVILRCKPM